MVFEIWKKIMRSYHRSLKRKKYDQEARLRKEMDRVREELRELHMLIGVEGYLPYFYENTECILD
mgnify:FL=1